MKIDVTAEVSHSQNQLSDHRFLPVYAGIFLISVAVLMFQVALTRVFAIVMWYHFAYLIISLALLGFGASGSFLTLIGVEQKSEKQISNILSICSLLFGLTLLISFFSITRISIDTFIIWNSPADFFALLVIFLILAVPFLMCGFTIGTCLTRYSNRVSSLYFVDLIGAALGALCTPFILEEVSNQTTVMIAAIIATLGALAFYAGSSRYIQLFKLGLLGVAIVLAVGMSGGWSFIPKMQWDIPFAPNKKAAVVFSKSGPDSTINSATAQVDISAEVIFPTVMGGEFGVVDKQSPPGRFVTQDGTAPTMLYRNSGDYKKFKQLDDTQAASAYISYHAAGHKEPKVMVIGVGGGIDVMIALYHNAKSVTAVEINQAMIKMDTIEYADYIGNLFSNPRVTLVNEDGRSYLSRNDETYDIIQLSGVDTFTALATGAYTLSESYLYTVEAVKKMYSKLSDKGYINFSRMILEDNPRETPRLANTARFALSEMGVEHPEKHIVVLQAHRWASTIIKKEPFTAAEISVLEKFSEDENFRGLAYDPLIQDSSELWGQTPEHKRMKELLFTLLNSTESERETFVRDYVYELTPATDDRPFFFNYFKFSNFFTQTRSYEDGPLVEYVPDFPVGHMVLVTSFGMIFVMAAIFILLPLRFLKKRGTPPKLEAQTFVYFTALGLGFMIVEVGMIQKFILFLGHPIYSMSVVLAGILAFSGFGALATNRISLPNTKVVYWLMAAIIALSVFNTFVIDSIIEPLQGNSLAVRIFATLAILAPTAFVLGMPLPIGVKVLERHAPQLIPWGWAINGFLSVLSSIVAVFLAMLIGFSWIMLVAGGVYVVGLMVMAPNMWSGRENYEFETPVPERI